MRQPLGGSGIELDIISGMPRKIKTREEHQATEELKEQKALQEAIAISQELPTILPMIAQQLESRILELMKKDERCLGILQLVAALKVKIDLERHVTSKIRRQAMGIVLSNMTDETKVAPEGIPTKE